jgi:hypothetical protein
MKKFKTNKNAVSLAGEFAVLSQLALRNYDANMTLGHTKGVDILVSKPGTKKMFRLEVKTKLRLNDQDVAKSEIFGTVVGGWIMNAKHERPYHDPSLFYCFVIIWKRTSKVRFFIVPSKVVSKYVKDEHTHWRNEKKKQGQRVSHTDMRTFRVGFQNEKYSLETPTAEQYENNWRFDK